MADVGAATFPNQAESFTIANEQYDEFIAGQIQLERVLGEAAEAQVDRELLARQRQAAEAELSRLGQQIAEVQALQARLMLLQDAAESGAGAGTAGQPAGAEAADKQGMALAKPKQLM